MQNTPRTADDDRPNFAVRLVRWVFGLGYARNIGGTEQAIRYLLGAAGTVLGLYLLAFPVIGFASNLVLALCFLAAGSYLVYEARVQYCPLNATLGRSTYRDD